MSVALNIQGPSRSPSHSPSGSTVDQWLHSRRTESRELDKVSDQLMGPMIPRVPSEFREMEENTDCYEPRIFLKDERVIALEMCGKVKELIGYARGCYAEELKRSLEKQKLRNEEVGLVTRDLFLLENQLPFQGKLKDFLERIRALPLQRESCREKISKYFFKLSRVLSFKSPRSDDISYNDANHLLELFYNKFIMINPKTSHDQRGIKWYRGTSLDRYHSVKELKNVGIHFKPSNASILTDVKFKQTFFGGGLHVPPLSIEDSTKPLLLNLAAYEACSGESSGLLTSSICFMRSLIDQPEDVKELRSQGILRTTIGSGDEIAKLFKEMTTNLVPHPSSFIDVKTAIESHFRNTLKRWIIYYRAPISTAVVKYSFIFGFAASAIQAYLAETHKKSGSGICSCPNATQIHP
ncbi:unnamed protein product [Dovyalis caffra]|uniref:Uncharacterized protein n=1 Tax=Dovyalis caffra TaxID=77055 RepID=A0AAV1QTY7_9ROSI|nr:unnamed protein product [Dovyalis caffra]